MAKDRDWIDYANLAANLTQNLQLRRANQTLEGLQHVAAERAIREQEQRDQERQLDRLRERISQIGDDVGSLREHLGENPRAALALGLQIKGLLEKHDVTTASFSAWDDKDRLKQIIKGLEIVCEQAAALLTAQQREEAAKCAKYLAEGDGLIQLISLQRRKEVFDLGRQQFEKKLAVKQSELTKLKAEQASIRLPAWQRVCTVVGGLGLAFSGVWLLGVLMSEPLDAGGFEWSPKPAPVEPPFSVPGAVTFVIFIVSVALTVVALSATARISQKKLIKQIKSLKAEIANAEAEMSRYDQGSPIRPKSLDPFGRDHQRERERIMMERGEPSQDWATRERMDELRGIYDGDRSSEQYEAMKRGRDAFIESVFGSTESSNATKTDR